MEPALYKAAAKTGDIQFLQTNLQNEALLRQVTPNKNNILHIAALFNKLNFFKQAMSIPCSFSLLKQPNSKGDTPLHVAARVGEIGVTDFIVKFQLPQKPRDVEKGEDNCVGDKKELIRMVNHDGENALHLAARYGHENVVAALLNSDPELTTLVNHANESAFYIAIMNFKFNVAKLIMDHSPVFSLHGVTNGRTALHAVLSNYHTHNDVGKACTLMFRREEWHQIMEKITEVRPEMTTEGDTTGWTPLHLAADLNVSTAIVIKLLVGDDDGQRQSAAYMSDKNGETALHIAARRGHVNVLKEIISVCPDCWDIADNKGRTALHSAVLGGDAEAVVFIMGLDGLESRIVNEADEDGNTPLHLAAMHNNLKIMSILESDERVHIFAANKDHLKALDLLIISKEQEKCKPKPINDYASNSSDVHRTTSVVKKKRDESAAFLEITATLVATVTFSAAFSLPGGYIQSGSVGEGMAVLASKKVFQAFIIFDIIAFFAATNAFYQLQSWIKLVDERKYVEMFVAFAFLAMQLAFTCGLYVVLGNHHDQLASAALTICLLFLSYECVRVFWSYYKKTYHR